MERGEIEESLRHISGRTSVYYRNLVTGATIGIREELPMMAASVIKIPIAHKTGEDDGITHDVGIFYAEEPFVLCCLGNGTDCPAFDRFMQDIAWRLYEEQGG